MVGVNYDIVDTVSRETAAHLEGTDAILAYGPEGETVYVLEPRED
jgi:hypothetical protein